LGIFLDSFKIISTNEQWQQDFVVRSSQSNLGEIPVLRNLLTVDCFGCYCDPILDEDSGVDSPPKHHFFLQTENATVRFTRVNESHMGRENRAQNTIDLNISDVPLQLEDTQYQNVLHLFSRISTWKLRAPFDHLRPKLPILMSPRLWWMYVIGATVLGIKSSVEKWSWKAIQLHGMLRSKYILLWMRHRAEMEGLDAGALVAYDPLLPAVERINAPSAQPSSAGTACQTMLQQLEIDLSVENIILFRKVAERRLAKLFPSHLPKSGERGQEIGGSFKNVVYDSAVSFRNQTMSWVYAFIDSTDTGLSSRSSNSLVHDVADLQHTNEFVDFETSGCFVNLNKTEFNAKISSVSISLLMGEQLKGPEAQRTLITGSFEGFCISLASRINGSTRVEASIQAIEAFDNMSSTSAFSKFVAPKSMRHLPTKHGSSLLGYEDKPIFELMYDTDPLEQYYSTTTSANPVANEEPNDQHHSRHTFDGSLSMTLEPLEITYNPNAKCWTELGAFFNIADLDSFAELKMTTLNALETIKSRTEAKLEFAMSTYFALDVDINVHAPVVLIPEDETREDSELLVVDLGNISIKTSKIVGRVFHQDGTHHQKNVRTLTKCLCAALYLTATGSF
jgi:hypothetical protein